MTDPLVVVGAGLAGWCAAVAAAEAGATVLVLEKTSAVGGSTILSGGFFAFAGTPEQERRGIADTPERLAADLIEVGQGRNVPELVTAYAQGQRDLRDWLVERGLVIEDIELSSGQSAPRSHRGSVTALIGALRDRALALGVRLELDTRIDSLVLDGGRVVGVVARGRRIAASGVILASGGFSRSEELLALYAPAQAGALRIGGAGNTGDGLVMATVAGAGARDFEHIKGTFGCYPVSAPTEHEILLAYYLGAIIVNLEGERFVDESISYKLLGDACLAQPGAVAFQLFDQGVFDSAPRAVPLFDPRPLLDEGLLVAAATLEELAEKIRIAPGTLRRTVEEYNASIGSGSDRFGRTHLVSGAGDAVQLSTAPYYAYRSTTALLATYCGITVDADARVTDEHGAAIPGLWAAGEIVGGFHGAAYMTGSSLGKASFFGRAAGRAAAIHHNGFRRSS